MAQHFSHVAQQPHRGQLEGPLEATAARSGEERPLDRRQVRLGPADLPEAFVEPQGPIQLGFGVHLQPLARKAGEGAEALAAGLITDADRQHGDAGGLQLRPSSHQGLGVFESVEIPQLGEQKHQETAALSAP